MRFMVTGYASSGRGLTAILLLAVGFISCLHFSLNLGVRSATVLGSLLAAYAANSRNLRILAAWRAKKRISHKDVKTL